MKYFLNKLALVLVLSLGLIACEKDSTSIKNSAASWPSFKTIPAVELSFLYYQVQLAGSEHIS